MSIAHRTNERAAFRRMHRLLGRPTLEIVPPISDWNLPADVVYDQRRDQFVQNGQIYTADWRLQPSMTVDFLPGSSQISMSLTPAGLLMAETNKILLLWEQTIEAAIKTAWGISIDGELFRIGNVTILPLGVSEPTTIQVHLQEDANA